MGDGSWFMGGSSLTMNDLFQPQETWRDGRSIGWETAYGSTGKPARFHSAMPPIISRAL
mgnify:CR=1 FL=1